MNSLKTHGIRKVRTPAGDEAWVVTSYPLGRALLADSRLGRSHPAAGQAPRYSTSPLFGRPWGAPEDERQEHDRFRRLLSRSFGPGRMERLRPAVGAVVTRCLEELGAADRPADLHRLVCRPLPVRVMCLMLGVPEADFDRFAGWADAWTSIADPDAARTGQAALLEYFASLVEQRSGDLGSDIISDLIRCGSTTEEVTAREIVALSATLLFAGYETTVAALDKAMLLLLSHPQAYRALGRDAATRSAAVEETLRFANVLPAEEENRHLGIVRYAHDDVAIDDGSGLVVRKGDLVMIQKLKCNQDTAEFTCPNVFDISRHPNRHLTFGHGRRYCPGAPLARLEMEELFERLPMCFPRLRLAVDVSDVRRVPKRLTPQAEALPVTW